MLFSPPTGRKRMTVCIAVACQDQGQPRIVLCSDTRLDYADLGSTNTACKSDVLGYGWMVQLAGDWSGARGFCSVLKERVQNLPLVTTGDIENEARSAINEFMKSPLYQSRNEYQTILSGFVAGLPVILEASIHKGKPMISLGDSFMAIGYGATIASVLLTLRECTPHMPLPYAAYLAYEAKRCSEKTGFVGPFTALVVQAPYVPATKDKANVEIMNDLGKANLENIYSGVWKVPFVETPPLPPKFFLSLEEIQGWSE
jgi:hypothetical protein